MISKTYMNGEKYNLNIMIIIFNSIISCNILGLEENFQGICFDHAFSKAYHDSFFVEAWNMYLSRLDKMIYKNV